MCQGGKGGADKNRWYLTRAKILPSVRHVSGVRDALPLAAGTIDLRTRDESPCGQREVFSLNEANIALRRKMQLPGCRCPLRYVFQISFSAVCKTPFVCTFNFPQNVGEGHSINFYNLRSNRSQPPVPKPCFCVGAAVFSFPTPLPSRKTIRLTATSHYSRCLPLSLITHKILQTIHPPQPLIFTLSRLSGERGRT